MQVATLVHALEVALASRGNDRRVLSALLDAWRAAPDPLLAAAIDDVSLRLERARTRGFGNVKPEHRGKLLRTTQLDVESAPWLLALVALEPWKAKELAPFLGLPPDPRIAALLPTLSRWSSNSAQVVALRQIHDLPERAIPHEARELYDRVVGAIAERVRIERALVAEVFASPDEDGPRQIYADFLLEHDHPRGELVAMALAAREQVDQRRLRHLLDRFAWVWLGALASACRFALFARGFPDHVWLHCDERIRPTIGLPAWATIRTVTIDDGSSLVVDLILDPALRSLRTLALERETLVELCRRGSPLPVTSLSLRDVLPEDFANGGAVFPHLTEVVTRAGTLTDDAVTARFLEAQAAAFPQLRRNEFVAGASRFVIEDGVLTTTDCEAARVAAVLDALPTGSLTGVAHDDPLVRTAAARHGC